MPNWHRLQPSFYLVKQLIQLIQRVYIYLQLASESFYPLSASRKCIILCQNKATCVQLFGPSLALANQHVAEKLIPADPTCFIPVNLLKHFKSAAHSLPVEVLVVVNHNEKLRNLMCVCVFCQ